VKDAEPRVEGGGETGQPSFGCGFEESEVVVEEQPMAAGSRLPSSERHLAATV
jgi:hypothetical protein